MLTGQPTVRGTPIWHMSYEYDTKNIGAHLTGWNSRRQYVQFTRGCFTRHVWNGDRLRKSVTIYSYLPLTLQRCCPLDSCSNLYFLWQFVQANSMSPCLAPPGLLAMPFYWNTLYTLHANKLTPIEHIRKVNGKWHGIGLVTRFQNTPLVPHLICSSGGMEETQGSEEVGIPFLCRSEFIYSFWFTNLCVRPHL